MKLSYEEKENLFRIEQGLSRIKDAQKHNQIVKDLEWCFLLIKRELENAS